MNVARFFAELKRRNVYKMAIGYAVLAWLLMQIATQVFPFLEIPNWAIRLVIMLLALGFPTALVLAWAQPRSANRAWIYFVIIAGAMGIDAYSSGIGIIRVCWIILAVVWLRLRVAASTKRTVYRESSGEQERYWFLPVIAFVLMFKSSSLPSPFAWLAIPHTESSAWIGAFLCVIGLLFAIWARVILGRNWSGVITLKEGHELIESGPYRIVRHPIYTGILAMFAGTAIAMGYFGGVLGLLLLFVSFWVKLRREEDLMLKQFPNKYSAYQHRVKRIVPFLV
jgi:protein-S-isoprenylcysteine O-methyltransferase Ste14